VSAASRLISTLFPLQSLKGHTAREANLVLDRSSGAESYDHWVRDDAERERIAAYIESNPVRAGLVDSADKYRWSSAGKSVEMSLDAADTSVRATSAWHGCSLKSTRRWGGPLGPRPTPPSAFVGWVTL
jgi:hypothetical protein